MRHVYAAAAAAYLALKAQWSTLNDTLKSSAPKAAVPRFASPREAWAYLVKMGRPYTGDPLMGVGDFYLNPARLQAAFETGQRAIDGLAIDCDDVAGWSFAALRAAPFVTELKVVTVVDRWVKLSHVGCVGRHNGRAFAIDTNGVHDLPDLSEATLLGLWNGIYRQWGADYVAALDTPYPF